MQLHVQSQFAGLGRADTVAAKRPQSDQRMERQCDHDAQQPFDGARRGVADGQESVARTTANGRLEH